MVNFKKNAFDEDTDEFTKIEESDIIQSYQWEDKFSAQATFIQSI